MHDRALFENFRKQNVGDIKMRDIAQMTKKELAEEIKRLKKLIAQTEDFDERLELEKKRADLIDELYRRVKESRDKSPTFSAKELLSKRPPVLEFFHTGIRALDENLNGLIRGGFVQVAAASGAGKTTIMARLLANLAQGQKVAHFDFEMGEYKLFFLLQNFLKTDRQKENYYINTETHKLDDLVKEITYLADQGIKVFLIDSKMKIETDEKDTYKSASKISHELSKLTKSGNITIILINQMSDSAIREGRAELKGSGDQVYDSDVILVLTKVLDRENSVKGEPPVHREDRRGIMCVKNRFGRLFKDEIYRHEILPNEITATTAQVVEMPTI